MSRCVSTIVSGSTHTLSLNHDGFVFSFGYSTCEVHGHEKKLVFLPTIIPTLHNIKSITTGTHTVCLDYDGNVYTFGSNSFGQLGIGVDKDTLLSTHIPQKVNIPPCKEVSCGNTFTICFTNDGFLYSFGNNNFGQLGIGSNEKSYNSPQLLSSITDIEFIECGGEHAFCKTLHNIVYCWGFNNNGQLGLGNVINQNTPILCSSLLYDDASEEIVDIKCGNAHTLILTSNGDVLSCGHNKAC